MKYFDTNFMILLSFLIFVGLCWRYFAKPIVRMLDQQIQEFTQEIEISAQACVEAQKSYYAAQKHSEKVHKDILALHERTYKDLEKIKEQAKIQLASIMTLKDKAHQSRIDRLYREKIHWLRAEVSQQILGVFEEILRQKASQPELSLLTDHMVKQMTKLPTTL